MFFNFCCKISEYLRHRLLLKISIRELTLHEKYKISNKYKKSKNVPIWRSWIKKEW